MASSSKKARREPVAETNYSKSIPEIKPITHAQEIYLNSIKTNTIVFGVGSAGTGKTFVAAGYAANELYYKRIDRVIITRPNVEVGRSLGYLPGTLDEKYLPYLDPFESTFIKFLGKGFYEYCIKSKNIDPRPLGFMRGASFDNCIILVDEAQNATKQEFHMLLSRIGRDCKVIVSGDDEQADIRDSGLVDAIDRLSHIHGVDVVRFVDSDIVRSRMCKEVIKAYRK